MIISLNAIICTNSDAEFKPFRPAAGYARRPFSGPHFSPSMAISLNAEFRIIIDVIFNHFDRQQAMREDRFRAPDFHFSVIDFIVDLYIVSGLGFFLVSGHIA